MKLKLPPFFVLVYLISFSSGGLFAKKEESKIEPTTENETNGCSDASLKYFGYQQILKMNSSNYLLDAFLVKDIHECKEICCATSYCNAVDYLEVSSDFEMTEKSCYLISCYDLNSCIDSVVWNEEPDVLHQVLIWNRSEPVENAEPFEFGDTTPSSDILPSSSKLSTNNQWVSSTVSLETNKETIDKLNTQGPISEDFAPDAYAYHTKFDSDFDTLRPANPFLSNYDKTFKTDFDIYKFLDQKEPEQLSFDEADFESDSTELGDFDDVINTETTKSSDQETVKFQEETDSSRLTMDKLDYLNWLRDVLEPALESEPQEDSSDYVDNYISQVDSVFRNNPNWIKISIDNVDNPSGQQPREDAIKYYISPQSDETAAEEKPIPESQLTEPNVEGDIQPEPETHQGQMPKSEQLKKNQENQQSLMLIGTVLLSASIIFMVFMGLLLLGRVWFKKTNGMEGNVEHSFYSYPQDIKLLLDDGNMKGKSAVI